MYSPNALKQLESTPFYASALTACQDQCRRDGRCNSSGSVSFVRLLYDLEWGQTLSLLENFLDLIGIDPALRIIGDQFDPKRT